MGIIDDMRKSIKTSGGGRKGIFALRDGDKKKIRFLEEMDAPTKFSQHDKYGSFQTLCLQHMGKECPLCDNDDDAQRDYTFYCWQVFDYSAGKVVLFYYKANENSPIPHLINFFEQYGTIMDRDYTITRTGNRTDTSYTPMPHDKKKFKKEAKMMSKKRIVKRLAAAFPHDGDDDGDDGDD